MVKYISITILLSILLLGERLDINISSKQIYESEPLIVELSFESDINNSATRLESELELKDILDYLTTVPPLKYPLSADLEAKLPEVTGALLYVLAKIIKIVDGNDRAVDHESINRAKEILDLTL